MNDIVKRNLSSTSITTLDEDMAAQLLAGIEDSQATTLVPGGGKDLIKLDKASGLWGIGQADEPMQVGSQWWINILSICHGYVNWSDYKGTKKNERLGEIMVPMSSPKPPKPGPIDGFPFKEQRSFEAICLNGEDQDREVQFKNGSVGTLKAFKKLEDAIKIQLRNDRAHPCPVIVFKSEKYKHGDYGWIQNPIFEIVAWADLQGNIREDDDAPAPVKSKPEPKQAAAAPPPKRTKPALVTPAAQEEPEVAEGPAEEPAPAAAVRGQRRRPVG
jgi:hypothetical protein